MMTPEKRSECEQMCRDVKAGKLGYQPAKKSRLSKSAPNKFGPAPDFL